MYCGHARLCVCLSVCLFAAACPRYCTELDVTWGSGRGCPLVVHYWADLQSVLGLRCHGNLTRTWKVSEYMLVLALCLVINNVTMCHKSDCNVTVYDQMCRRWMTSKIFTIVSQMHIYHSFFMLWPLKLWKFRNLHYLRHSSSSTEMLIDSW